MQLNSTVDCSWIFCVTCFVSQITSVAIGDVLNRGKVRYFMINTFLNSPSSCWRAVSFDDHFNGTFI